MKQKNDPHEAFEADYFGEHEGYVLITCDKPSDSGEMQVKMTYGGSPDLANLLLDNAQTLLEDE